MYRPEPVRSNPKPLLGRPRRPPTQGPDAGAGAGPRPRSTSLSASQAVGGKTQRTTKTSHKLVVLPEEPQTKEIPDELVSDNKDNVTLVTVKGDRDYKSEGERMSKQERNRAGYKRLTAYCVADAFRTKLLAAFLKREHNVTPRVFDEALYAMYHHPLLPGYGPNVNIRSSAPLSSGQSIQHQLSEAEENGYDDNYFTLSDTGDDGGMTSDGFIPSSSPLETRTPHEPRTPGTPQAPPRPRKVAAKKTTAAGADGDAVAEVVFFAYGVAVFFGFLESQERSIIDDLTNAGILVRQLVEDDWEVEECHYALDPHAVYPRIYNDLFTFKSPSHLLKISIAHALAQSTLLARYESKCQVTLSDERTISIPRTLASTGEFRLRRRDALRLTGRLFQLKRDINLLGNVMDVPDLFWSEASLKDLYDAVREYMEISLRVQVLNEKLAVASDLLDIIHGHLNNSAMENITWIIIWLIVVACLVEMGEVLARLVVHETPAVTAVRNMISNMISSSAGSRSGSVASFDTSTLNQVAAVVPVSREQALLALENVMKSQGS